MFISTVINSCQNVFWCLEAGEFQEICMEFNLDCLQQMPEKIFKKIQKLSLLKDTHATLKDENNL